MFIVAISPAIGVDKFQSRKSCYTGILYSVYYLLQCWGVRRFWQLTYQIMAVFFIANIGFAGEIHFIMLLCHI